MVFIIIGLLIVVAYFLYTKVLKRPEKAAPVARNPYRATSIESGEGACDAVKAIAGKRYLDVERQTPRFPLPDCDAATCQCKYVKHEDRRDDNESRRLPGALQSQLYDRTGNTERRKARRGRRKTDFD